MHLRIFYHEIGKICCCLVIGNKSDNWFKTNPYMSIKHYFSMQISCKSLDNLSRNIVDIVSWTDQNNPMWTFSETLCEANILLWQCNYVVNNTVSILIGFLGYFCRFRFQTLPKKEKETISRENSRERSCKIGKRSRYFWWRFVIRSLCHSW